MITVAHAQIIARIARGSWKLAAAQESLVESLVELFGAGCATSAWTSVGFSVGGRERWATSRVPVAPTPINVQQICIRASSRKKTTIEKKKTTTKATSKQLCTNRADEKQSFAESDATEVGLIWCWCAWVSGVLRRLNGYRHGDSSRSRDGEWARERWRPPEGLVQKRQEELSAATTEFGQRQPQPHQERQHALTAPQTTHARRRRTRTQIYQSFGKLFYNFLTSFFPFANNFFVL